MLRAGGFVDGDLRLADFPGEDDLVAWVDRHQEALAHWSAAERDGLVEVASLAQELLDTVERHCLVHSDLNPKNLLVDPETLRVTGLLDWEFAHAGSPLFDLAILLRNQGAPPPPGFANAVTEGYVGAGGRLPDDWQAAARVVDLVNLCDFLAGPNAGNAMVACVRAVIQNTVDDLA